MTTAKKAKKDAAPAKPMVVTPTAAAEKSKPTLQPSNIGLGTLMATAPAGIPPWIKAQAAKIGAKTSDQTSLSDIKIIYPTSCPPLDIALGGGLCSGKVIEVSGWESQGKSTVVLYLAYAFIDYWLRRQTAKVAAPFSVLWKESESAQDGVRNNFIALNYPNFVQREDIETVEDGWEMQRRYLESCISDGIAGLSVWDTIGAAQTLNEKQGGQDAGGMMEKPRIIRRMFRDLQPLIAKAQVPWILVNHLHSGQTGEVTSPGGGGIRFHSSVRWRFTGHSSQSVVPIKAGETQIGHIAEIQVIKNKITGVRGKFQLAIMNATGFDPIATTMIYLERAGVVSGSASSWKKMSYPSRIFDPAKDKVGQPTSEMIELNYQNANRIKEVIQLQHPHLFDWCNYKCYEAFARTDALVKVKVLQKLWDYERLFFGGVKTTISDHERAVAEKMYQIEMQSVPEDEKDDR
jgi:RecA/RadA recombinase